MEASFWHQRWQDNEIGFHQSEANPFLVEHFQALSMAPVSRIFIPLCGKTLDIGWLLAAGYRVVGVELSEMAIEQLFADLEMRPKISEAGKLRHYSSQNLDLFVGDFFHLTAQLLGPVDAIYDRAAMVALPPEMRARYAAHLMTISHRAPQLLVAYDYDQSLVAGPPFSVPGNEVDRHYGSEYRVSLVGGVELPDNKRGPDTRENVWLLQPE